MLIGREIHIVTPFGPPRSAYEEFAVAEDAKISLKDEWILNLTDRKLLITLKCTFDRRFEMI